MLKARTHFKQVPLEIVRKIVEEQILSEITAERDPIISMKKREKNLLAAQERPKVSSRTSSEMELSKQ